MTAVNSLSQGNLVLVHCYRRWRYGRYEYVRWHWRKPPMICTHITRLAAPAHWQNTSGIKVQVQPSLLH